MIEIAPTPSNRKKFESELNRGLSYLKRPTTSPAARARKVRELKRDLSSWTENFRLCDGIEVYGENWLTKIVSAGHVTSTMPQPGKQPMSSTTKMVFHLHPDQKEIVTAAIKNIKEQTGTAYQSVALEYMAQSYLGTGLHFSHWKPAVLYALKHSQDPAAFLVAVMEYLESICPEATINAEITWKEQSAA